MQESDMTLEIIVLIVRGALWNNGCCKGSLWKGGLITL